MKISDVKTCRVITPYDMTLVKVFTDEGVSGVGEAYHGQGVRDVIINPYRSLREIVVGEDPRNVERLYERMIQRLSGMGTLAYNKWCRENEYEEAIGMDKEEAIEAIIEDLYTKMMKDSDIQI